MATKEVDGLLQVKDAAGDVNVIYPVTKAENVEGLSDGYVALDESGKIPANKLPPEFSGTAATADKLKTARAIRTNLASTAAASFNGSANVTPGVTGTLPITNGGTGATTAAAARTKLGAAAKPIVVNVILTASGWTGTSAPYTQTVTVSGVLEDETLQLIQPVSAAASRTAYAEAGVYASAQAADSLTFSCSEKPAEDLTVYVVVLTL